MPPGTPVSHEQRDEPGDHQQVVGGPRPGQAEVQCVDEEECRVADTILKVLEQEKGANLLRMLRLNRISILRLALGEGLNLLTAKVEKGEKIL